MGGQLLRGKEIQEGYRTRVPFKSTSSGTVASLPNRPSAMNLSKDQLIDKS
ncbi:hypothetical protein I79_022950 [Cricetulus griseus]|uniref:Uncharacterized protein n=1 Tax=Cricetulus griseus TaxID=10029 RepID=G3IGN0_CRIGR|nr:hypothetical protein I79_022950 [Cricetulus griseus]